MKLKLLGKPRFQLREQKGLLHENAPMKLLVLICLQVEKGLGRDSARRQLWGHLSEQHGKAQLRQALTALRRWLDEVGASNCFDLSGVTLSASKEVAVDAVTLLRKKRWEMNDMAFLRSSFMEGWSHEPFIHLKDALFERFAEEYPYLIEGMEPEGRADALKSALEESPCCLRIAELYVAHLKDSGREADASEAIIAFETAWVDRFGSLDIPVLALEGREAGQALPALAARKAPSSPLRKAGIALLMVFVPVLVIYAVVRQDSRVRDGQVLVKGSQLVSESGHDYRVTEFHLEEGRIQSISKLFNGDVLIRIEETDRAFLLRNSSTGYEPHGKLWSDSLSDKSQYGELISDAKPRSPSTAAVAGKRLKIEPTALHARSGGFQFVNQTDFVFLRLCDHPWGCHIELWICKKGEFTSISKLIGQPQVAVPTVIGPKTIYGKFSNGKADHWKYRLFGFDISSGSLRTYEGDPIEHRMLDGQLVRLPEKIENIEGDYVTTWSGTAAVQRKSGVVDLVRAEGQSRFYEILFCGNLALVARTEKTINRGSFSIVDMNTGRRSALDRITGKLWETGPLTNGDGFYIRTTQLGQHFLVEALR